VTERRPIDVLEWFRPAGSAYGPKKKRLVKRAFFLDWSVDHEDYQEFPGHFPVAIIENLDGSVETVEVELIRFQDAAGYSEHNDPQTADSPTTEA
jgi:hypothetical protein